MAASVAHLRVVEATISSTLNDAMKESSVVTDAALTSEILRSLEYRDRAVSVGPSQIARSITADRVWRPLVPRIRKLLVQLIQQQRVIVTRGTRMLSVEEIEGGTIRIRRGPRFD